MKRCVLLATVVGMLLTASVASAHPQPGGFALRAQQRLVRPRPSEGARPRDGGRAGGLVSARGSAKCKNGRAAEYACDNVDLLSQVPLAELGGARAGNDMWGWRDPKTKREYALVGPHQRHRRSSTSRTPAGRRSSASCRRRPSARVTRGVTSRSTANHAYVVSEHFNHGMQVFDLTRLRDARGRVPKTFTADTVYDEVSNTHNLDINEDTGFAYLVGTSTCRRRPAHGRHPQPEEPDVRRLLRRQRRLHARHPVRRATTVPTPLPRPRDLLRVQRGHGHDRRRDGQGQPGDDLAHRLPDGGLHPSGLADAGRRALRVQRRG